MNLMRTCWLVVGCDRAAVACECKGRGNCATGIHVPSEIPDIGVGVEVIILESISQREKLKQEKKSRQMGFMELKLFHEIGVIKKKNFGLFSV